MDVSIIVVSYNTKEMTLACIDSVFSETKNIKFELIVFDNASSDGSAEAIEKQFPDINLIKSNENIGFARANNSASQQAKGKFLLLLNPDTVVLDGAIEKLVAFAEENPSDKIYGGRTFFADKTLNHASCWKKISLWSAFCYGVGLTSLFRRSNLFDPEAYGSWQRDDKRHVDIISGCFLLIEFELWKKLDGFLPQFFMYGEDADLCLRAVEYGANPVISPDATIIHYGGASEKVRADKMVRILKAKSQLMKCHWKPGYVFFGVKMYTLSSFTRSVVSNFMVRVGVSSFRTKADVWKEIWQRRKEWESVLQ